MEDDYQNYLNNKLMSKKIDELIEKYKREAGLIVEVALHDARELHEELELARNGMMPNHTIAKILVLIRNVTVEHAELISIRDNEQLNLIVRGYAEQWAKDIETWFSITKLCELDDAYAAMSTLIYDVDQV